MTLHGGPVLLRKATQLLTTLAYYWLLCYADRAILAPAFGYQGLSYRPASFWAQAGVITMILACTALTPMRLRQPSDGVLWMLLPLVVVPVLAVAATDPLFTDVERGLIISVAGAYLLLAACSRIPRITGETGRSARRPRRQPWAIMILLSCASYGLMFATFGVHFRLLAFGDVYGARAAFTDQAPGVLGYLLDWQAAVINPLFITWGIRQRRIVPLAAGVAGDLIIYSVTGYKSVLFSVLAVAALLAATRQKDEARPPDAGTRTGFAFATLAAVSIAADMLGNSIVWTSLFVRRLSLVAGVNTGYYFQYFAAMPKAHLAYGLTGKLLGSASSVPPAGQIAWAVYHTTSDPNANLWADAYGNFGYGGVIAFTLVLAGFLWVYDRAARGVSMQVAVVLVTVSGLSLANSALFTCLLTHGMLLALLIVTQLPRSVDGDGPARLQPVRPVVDERDRVGVTSR